MSDRYDGVRDLALWVDDARDAFSKAVERGAEPVHEPRVVRDDEGEIVIAAIVMRSGLLTPFIRRHRAALSLRKRRDRSDHSDVQSENSCVFQCE